MEFVSGLHVTPTKKDSSWVIVDRLIKSAHFLPVRTDYSLHKLARLYIFEIVRHMGYRYRVFRIVILILLLDSRRRCMRHLILEDMLRSCVIDFRDSWEEHFPLTEFAYNNSFQLSI
ncbi:Gag protease polyprotein [Gossypium australe]|uniref:Gag protease polyprotein n=1 Tax=Gossypium australe TaxID=47621 RepID=A0A5B6X127_9ROSI|nr:Gag protease polyprotein [Gossypium australe]